MKFNEDRNIKVLVADDHRMIRAGIRAMLSLSSLGSRFSVEEAETTEEAMEMVDVNPCHVLLMDYNLPGRGGAKATELILKKHSGIRVLGLSNYENRSYVEQMVQAGARGYVLKNIEPDTLAVAIRTVFAGKAFYSNEIAMQWIALSRAQERPDPLERLTTREREVLRQILAGSRDKEIAAQLFISKRTVDKHRQNLMAKLGVRNAVELVQAAMRMGVMG